VEGPAVLSASTHTPSKALPWHIPRECPSAGNSKLFTDATTVERCLSPSSENAVNTQIWCAIATYVLIAIIEKELQLDASLYTDSLRLHL
jgi:hypothetical protein